MDVITIIALSFSGAWVLHVVFRSIQTRWPENYTSTSSELDAHHRKGVGPFFLVRLGPVAAVAGLLSSTASRIDIDPAAVVTITLLTHLTVTDFRILRRFRSEAPRRLMYHAIAALCVTAAGLFGALVAALFPHLIPAPDELVAALWTAAFTAILAAAFLRATERRDERLSLEWVTRDVGSQLWAEIPAIANDHDADPYLVQAIVAAEVTQRPRWFRQLERALGIGTTYGVGQVTGTRSMTDRDSVASVAKAFSGYRPGRRPDGYLANRRLFELHVENHNSSPAFITDCAQYLDELSPTTPYFLGPVADDGFPAVQLHVMRREHMHVTLEGSAASLAAVIRARDPNGVSLGVRRLPDGPRRRPWSLVVPIEVESVRLSLEANDADPDEGIDVGLYYVDMDRVYRFK
ncbi:hypothetical protein IGS73_06225 [Janibacter indicus]|uniref:Uncharacterized protein n=1 Tax=Janibacter indicus TaxID=857417 RepID=A0A7L9J3U0_9MICO|nr:hypothetical protein [Janibacter indicus]QOK23969.1 hypothetical protein IGS73_06225 [Janibacter indicus]